MDTREVYERIYDHALANYENGGWDYFVECCGYEDFCRDSAEHNWQSYEEALEYYRRTYHTLNSIRRDIQAA